MNPFPVTLFQLGPLVVTDSVTSSLLLSLLLLAGGAALLRFARSRALAEIAYEYLEGAVTGLSTADVAALVPLVLTQWLFIGAANLLGAIPRMASPTRDLSVTAALAVVSFVAGHVFAFRRQGFAYLRAYVQPSPILLPFNILGELSRTLALALRLFGNMLSGTLIAAIGLYLAGLLVPVPLLAMGVLSGVVQAYIFGVLTLVFAVSSLATVARPSAAPEPNKEVSP